MITINIDPIIFQLGPLALRWYGLMYVVGITLSLLFVALPYARERGVTEDQVYDVFWPAALAGFLGGRLYYVVQSDFLSYLRDPLRIFAVWEGGMAFFGAIFAAGAVVMWKGHKLGIGAGRALDIAGMFAIFGQIFGRIGNIINGDILGYPTTLPWGFMYTNPHSFAPRHDVAYQPAAVYELISNIILFLFLWRLRNNRFFLQRPGTLFLLYLVLYSVSQFVLFFWRDNVIIDPFGLKQAQLTALVVIAATIPVWYWLLRKPPVQQQSLEQSTT